MHELLWTWSAVLLALGVALWAGWLDWRTRRIPNWLTMPALLAGFAINSIGGGWSGLKAAGEGAGLALALLLPLVLLRGLGAGDWKLMGALGALLGPSRMVVLLVGTILVAGVMALVEMFRKNRTTETVKNLFILLRGFITFRLVPDTGLISLDNPGLMKLPFGVAVAISAATFFCILAGEVATRILFGR
jgi:prepilin peptidase CpaA